MDAYQFLGSLLIGVALGWIIAAIAFKWVAIRKQQRADEAQVIRALRRAFAERRATYTIVPGPENPIGDGLVLETFRKQLDGGWKP